MRTSTIIAVTIAIGLGAPGLITAAHAAGTAAEGKTAAKGTGKSMPEAAGKLQTDATQTTKDAQALDVQKTTKGAGQVKQDTKDLHQSVKGTMGK